MSSQSAHFKNIINSTKQQYPKPKKDFPKYYGAFMEKVMGEWIKTEYQLFGKLEDLISSHVEDFIEYCSLIKGSIRMKKTWTGFIMEYTTNGDIAKDYTKKQ